MLYQQKIDLALSTKVGKGGAEQSAIDAALKQLPPIVETLQRRGESNDLAVLAQPGKKDDLAIINRWAEKIRDKFSYLVVLGTGGSSLGALTLCSARQPRFMPAGLTCHFVDNTDPDTLDQLLTQLPLSNTFFLAVSKSGSTVETLAQFMLALQAMQAESLPIADHILAITTPGDNPLRSLTNSFGGEVLDHDPNLGGRFSVLGNVGLLPAACAGLDVAALRAGALEVLNDTYANPTTAAPAIGAALQYALYRAGKTTTVMMPYCDRLDNFSRWFLQLWAESIGKDGKGTTPARALGAVDQHSQLQLYLDGPHDKLITILAMDHAGKGPKLSDDLARKSGMDYLGGHQIGNVLAAQQKATAETLTRKNVPVRWFDLADLDEKLLGALLMHFMLETMLMAGLMQIDAFDQPAVEESKNLTRENLAA